jgi:hypothetical protein
MIFRLGPAVVTQPGFIHDRGDDYRQHVAPTEQGWLHPCASLLRAGVGADEGAQREHAGEPAHRRSLPDEHQGEPRRCPATVSAGDHGLVWTPRMSAMSAPAQALGEGARGYSKCHEDGY